MDSILENKCSKIKLVITDVDGVLTDGGMFYTDKGDIMKRFFVRDGMGVTLLKKKNIPTLIITKEKTEMTRQWAKRMKITKMYEGVIQKEALLKKICEEYKVKPDQISYIGDDVNDIELLKKVGLAVVPNDAIEEAKKISQYICKTNSGQGAFRELVDLILSKQL
ncbi:MAG: HAD-IIIA family hydrolase [Candidatus Nitrosopelagicus sp.]|jgi:YrbI family 3-deoxy-D-manno-octulosonate 8-phosphate phosphatase|nr:HAD-IIIA family hydrolase [Candidatus Nitrosopelagicus sp.]